MPQLNTSQSMKHLKQLTVLSGLLTLGIGYAAGQSASSGPDTEDIIELTPFEVSASSDVGYRATSTLAGSRLNTDLKDVAAPISVLTAEFLEDLGATDIESAMAYVVGIETALTTDFATAEMAKSATTRMLPPATTGCVVSLALTSRWISLLSVTATSISTTSSA